MPRSGMPGMPRKTASKHITSPTILHLTPRCITNRSLPTSGTSFGLIDSNREMKNSVSSDRMLAKIDYDSIGPISVT